MTGPTWQRAYGELASSIASAFWADPAGVLGKHGERIKSSAPHRETWRLPTGNGWILVKQFALATTGSRLQWMLGSTAAQKEWRLLGILRERNVPVPAPVALGKNPGRAGCKAWLVIEYVADAVTFDRVNPPDNKGAVCAGARSLARAVAAMHVAGVSHRDLHSGNLLYQPQRDLWLITDFQHARAGRPSRTEFVNDLVQLQHCLGKKVEARVRIVFLREYLREFARLTGTEAGLTGREWRPLFGEIRSKSTAYLVEQAASRCRRCRVSNRDVAPVAEWSAPEEMPAGVLDGWVCRGMSRQLLLDAMALLGRENWHLEPDVVLIKNSQTAVTAVWSHPQGRLFIKERRASGRLDRARRLLGRAWLDRAWKAAWRLRYLHVSMPRPVMAVRTVHGDALVQAALGDSVSLDAVLRGTTVRDPLVRARSLDAVAGGIGRLHDCGVIHGRLTTARISLVAAGAHGVQAVFTGLDAAEFHRALTAGKRAADLAVLYALTFPFVSGAERRQFLRRYLRAQSQPVHVRDLLLALVERARQPLH